VLPADRPRARRRRGHAAPRERRERRDAATGSAGTRAAATTARGPRGLRERAVGAGGRVGPEPGQPARLLRPADQERRDRPTDRRQVARELAAAARGPVRAEPEALSRDRARRRE